MFVHRNSSRPLIEMPSNISRSLGSGGMSQMMLQGMHSAGVVTSIVDLPVKTPFSHHLANFINLFRCHLLVLSLSSLLPHRPADVNPFYFTV